MKRILATPLIVIIIFIIVGAGIAGAAVYFGGAGSTGDVSLQKGLVGWWKFDGNAKDNTPNANNGSVGGGSPSLITDRKGTANKAYNFAETTDYINVGNPSVLQISNNITVSFWYKPTFVGATTYYPMTKAVVGNQDFQFNSDTSGLKVLKGNGDVASPTAGALTAGNWYHIVWTYNSTTGGLLYKNAVSQGGGTGSGALTTGQSFHIGGTLYDGGYGAYGVLDDVRIYNRALTSAEITALYQSYGSGIQVSDLQKGLVGNWKMNGNAKDNTPYANDGTVTGAIFTTDRKGQANKAYSFNGTSDYVSIGTSNILPTGTSPFTVSFWLNAKNTLSASQQAVYLSLRQTTQFLWFIYNNAGTYESYLGFRNTGGARKDNIDYPNVLKDKWVHVTLIYNGGVKTSASSYEIYFNGVAFSSSTAATTFGGAATDNILGANAGGSDSWLQGNLDDVRIYNRALTQTEITALYQEYDPGIQVSDLQKGLVGNWKFDGNAKDNTPNTNDGTLTGTTLTTDRKSQANKSYSFNGTSDYLSMPISALGTGDYTIGTWFKFTGTQQYVTSPTNDAGSGDYTFPHVRIQSTTQINIGRNANGNYKFTWTSDSNWHNLVWERKSGTMYAFLDGVAQTVSSEGTDYDQNGINFTGTAFYSGRFFYSAVNYYKPGSIDDVRIYNRALSQTEITALYESY